MDIMPTISFITGIILIITGVVAISKCKNMYQLMFAAIPVIFGAQQIIEAFLLTVLKHPAYASTEKDIIYLYLFLAEVILPVWIPLSILQMEKKMVLKLVQIAFASIGIIISGYLAFGILTFTVDAQLSGSYTHYPQHYFTQNNLLIIPYLISTIAPFFCSSFRKMWLIGVGLSLVYIVVNILYGEFLISIWSFYAGWVSIIVYYVIKVQQPLK